jgi:uncharacterized protein
MNNPDILTEDTLKEGQWVGGIVDRITPIGIVVKLPGDAVGLLYKTDIYREIFIGEKVKVYVNKIREDGKIDLTLQKGGYKNAITSSTEIILTSLKSAGGFLPFTDKSDPDDILQQFQMSKKKFKEAIGALYKTRQIVIEEQGIRLL